MSRAYADQHVPAQKVIGSGRAGPYTLRAGLAHKWGQPSPGLFSRRVVLGFKVRRPSGAGPDLLSRLGPSKMISFPKSF